MLSLKFVADSPDKFKSNQSVSLLVLLEHAAYSDSFPRQH